MGRVWKYGDDVNTDVIFPGKYTYTITDPKEMAAHALEDLDPDFAGSVQRGDVIVAGENFGCGSSREQAAVCLREAGAAAVVAKSFARIFFRNAINSGLLAIVSKEAVEAAEMGSEMEIDTEAFKIRIAGKEFGYPPFSDEVKAILECGGLVPYTKRKIGVRS